MSHMNRFAVVVLLLLVAGSVMAATPASNDRQVSGSAVVEFPSDFTVNGQQLAAGSYKLTWSGTGDALTVTFKGNRHQATAPAKTLELSYKPARTAVMTTNKVLTQVEFSGKKTALTFNQ